MKLLCLLAVVASALFAQQASASSSQWDQPAAALAEQIAAILGVGLSTVRHHIKNLYSKMGTTRQGEFVALVLRSVAPLAGE